ncbi:NACHT domain- and WD repeat-containing protein 1-like [Diadema setosum]|uniref:NACHT domain- and WD repeat-containing protein 1-like n=1 Tax=Diadema setosum TaxID=31175 RepID=UPI003B3A4D97
MQVVIKTSSGGMDEEEVKIKQEIYAGSTSVPELPPKVVRIFVSSTFVDAEAERNVLLNEVNNTLWWWCKHNDLDFQLVDMRWGVRDEASTDHATTQICLREIQKCQRISMGPNFLFLLGQRYGYCPLPATIRASTYGLLEEHVTDASDTALLSSWYLRDDNSVPPVFVLQPISEDARERWSDISEQLGAILRRAATEAEQAGKITPIERHSFFTSVTELEIREALESGHPSQHCMGVTRSITDLEQHLGERNARKFCDMTADSKIRTDEQVLLSDLKKNYVLNRLDAQNVHHFDVRWSSKGIDPANSNHRAYLDQFAAAITNNTIDLIKMAQSTYKHYALGKDELFLEVAHHAQFCRDKCTNFQGCDDIIGAIFEKIRDDTLQKPVAIHGPSGSGKTSIMAMVQQNATKRLDFPCVVVARFLGTTSQSSTIINVLLSISRQICAAFQLPDTSETVKRTPKEMFPYFHSLLHHVSSTSDRHLLVMFDSLDQLESVHGAHRCLWLPRNLPPKIHIVVSTLPDMYGILQKLEQLLGKKDCFLPVEPLTEGTGDEIMHNWMRGIRRGVTDEQNNILKRAFLQCPQPLFLKLLFEEARRWKSYTVVREEDLAVTVRAAIWKLFERLERMFGRCLVSHALGYITAARSGLAEAELEDILSIDDDVLDEIYQYWSPVDPTTVRIPSLLWTRLKYELEEYLVERQADGRAVMVLYHRQFKEAAQARYLNDPETARERYRILSDFFQARWCDTPKTLILTQRNEVLQAYRKVASQPLRFDREFNRRKISELPYCLLFAQDIPRFIEQTFGNFEFLHTCFLANSTQYLIEELSWVLTHPSILGPDLHSQLALLQDTLRLAKPTLEFKNNLQPLAVELLGRLSNFATQYPSLIGRLVSGCHQWCRESSQPYLVPQISCFPTPGGPLRTTLIGHAGNILNLAISNDGKFLATSDQEGTVYIWELGLDELMHSLRDPMGGAVDQVIFSADNRWIVGWIRDSATLQVWSMQSGDPTSRMSVCEGTGDSNKEKGHQASIALTSNSQTIVCGVSDKIKMFSIQSGSCNRTLAISNGPIKGLCLSHGDKFVHVMTEKASCLTYDLETFDLVSDLSPHEGQVTCFASTESGQMAWGQKDGIFCYVRPDDQENNKWNVHLTEKVPGDTVTCLCIKEELNLVVVAADRIIYVWDCIAKKVKHELRGHDESVSCMRVTRGNKFLVSGGNDDVIMVWDLSQGFRIGMLEGQQTDISILIYHGNFIASASFVSPYIKLWDISPKYLSQQQHKFVDKRGVAAITGDYKYVIHQDNVTQSKICVWETSTGSGRAVDVCSGNSAVSAFTVTNSGKCAVVGCEDGSVVVCDIASQKVLSSARVTENKVTSIFLPAGDRVVAVVHVNNTIAVLAFNSLKVQRQLQVDVKGSLSHVCVTPRDALVMASDAGLVYVKLSASSELIKLEGNQSRVNCLAVSPDEQQLACGMEEANALVWDLQLTRADLQIKAKSVNHLCFTLDNTYIITAGNDRSIHVWHRSNGSHLLKTYVYSNLTSLAVTEGALVGTTLIGQVVAMTIKVRRRTLKRQTSRTCTIL